MAEKAKLTLWVKTRNIKILKRYKDNGHSPSAVVDQLIEDNLLDPIRRLQKEKARLADQLITVNERLRRLEDDK